MARLEMHRLWYQVLRKGWHVATWTQVHHQLFKWETKCPTKEEMKLKTSKLGLGQTKRSKFEWVQENENIIT
jgi:hypothetical protein